MSKIKKIIFICTGNIFRSKSAELLAQKYSNDSSIKFSSAGIRALPYYTPYQQTLERLKYYNINKVENYARQVTKEILKNQDLIICMTKYHQEFITNLGFDSVLFNEVAYNKKEDLMDDEEFKQKHGYVNLGEYIVEIVDYVNKSTPLIIKNIGNFI